jgi:hypothetical protein
MQHEGDEMKVASYPQSSRLLVAKGSRGNIFSMRVRMLATSRYLYTQKVEKSFPRVSSVCLWKPRISREASDNTLDIPGVPTSVSP